MWLASGLEAVNRLKSVLFSTNLAISQGEHGGMVARSGSRQRCYRLRRFVKAVDLLAGRRVLSCMPESSLKPELAPLNRNETSVSSPAFGMLGR